MHRFLASSLVICMVAHAQPRPMAVAAKEHLDQGMQYFSARDFTAALAAFDRGYAIDPHPDFLYAKAQALRLGGDCRASLVSYRAFLATNPPDTEAALARENITKCEQILATTTLDDPTRRPPPPPPAPEQWRDVPPPTWWRDPPGIAFAGIGVAALTTASIFALRARSHASDSEHTSTLDGWYEARAAYQRDRIIGGVALAVGIGATITATTRFIWVGTKRGTRLRVDTGTRGAALVVEGSW